MSGQIEAKRDDVIANHNTAQRILLTMLDDADADAEHMDELRFTDAMHGDLDFSVLRDRKMKNIKRIVFEEEGEVTHLRNIPDGITHIECANQLLTSIEVPASIEELDLNGNSLAKYQTTETPKLSVLLLSDNELTVLETKYAPNLRILECNNNRLSHLDLGPLRSLSSLHCSNNPLLKLEHVPDTLDDLIMENNPLIEVDRTSPDDDEKSPSGHASKPLNYLESVQEFFFLKQQYDTKLRKLKRDAFKRAANKKAGHKMAQMVRAPCISCKRKVGTVFDTKDGKCVAVCGDKSKPCHLNIQIYNGDYFNLFTMLNLYQDDLQDIQGKVIQQKLDTLFNYVGERTAVQEFKQQLEEYTETTEMYKRILDKYEDTYKNKETLIKIERKQEDIYRIRRDIADMQEEYRKTHNREILTSMIKLQLDELEPAVHNLRMLKYEVMMIEIDEDIGMSILVQRPVAFHKNDFTIGDGPSVIKYAMDH